MKRVHFARCPALIVVGAAIALSAGCDDGDGQSAATATPTVQPEAAAGEVVQRFVEALGTRDADALYAIQAEAYKQVCDREAFQAVADMQTQPLEGPAQIVVEGDAAGAALYEVQPDGSRRMRVVVPLVREANGEWRLAAPSRTGCTAGM